MAAPAFLDTWSEYVTPDTALAPFTTLKLGGPAAALVRPPDAPTLAAILQACRQQKALVRFLGNGSNILVREEGFPGIVIRFSDPSFQTITVSGDIISARTGASLGALVSTAARHNLGGLEGLVGLPGTVGGALKNDLKVKTGPLSQFVSRVELLNAKGDVTRHNRDDVPFDQLLNAPDAPVILGAEFQLHADQPEGIVKRLRKNWIYMKSQQPLSFERSARLFRDPPGRTANQLITQASAQLNKVGGAALSDRDANYVVVQDPVTARDVLRLMELVQAQVEERLGEALQPSLVVW
jgi:UDP-N-acetylmuramate dehydrogenase